MTSKGILTVALSVLGSAMLLGQTEAPRLPPAPANPPAPSLQSATDPGYAALIATCKTAPPARGGGPGGARGGGPGRGHPAAGPRDYMVTAIPGVIAAGQQWKFLWQQAGNNGDGILGLTTAACCSRRTTAARCLKLDQNGQTSVVYSDTHTGGALSMSPKGALFINERGLRPESSSSRLSARCWRTKIGRSARLHGRGDQRSHRRQQGRRLLHDGRALLRQPHGVVTQLGQNLQPNGVILSADEKTVYVTNGATLAAFDVQPDGSLTNQREFAKWEERRRRRQHDRPAGPHLRYDQRRRSGDWRGRQGARSDSHAAWCHHLAFGGKDKKMLYVLARGAKDANGERSGQCRAGLGDPDDRAGL